MVLPGQVDDSARVLRILRSGKWKILGGSGLSKNYPTSVASYIRVLEFRIHVTFPFDDF